MKPVRVLDLFCGNAPVRKTLLTRFPDSEVHYYGVDLSIPENILRERSRNRFKPHYFSGVRLNFYDHDVLRSQLNHILQGEKVDEIHLHMPALEPIDTSGVLSIFNDFLNNGGRVYHSSSDLHVILGYSLNKHRAALIESNNTSKTVTPRKVKKVYETGRNLLESSASKAGLKLEKFGLRVNRQWFTRLSLKTNSREQAVLNHVYGKNSDWLHSAVMMSIFRKPITASS